MIDHSILYQLAIKAAYDFRTVYGSYPHVIGVHYKRCAQLPPSIFFPNPPMHEIRLTVDYPNLDSLESMEIRRHEAKVEPVEFPGINWNGIYFAQPGAFPLRLIDNERLAQMAMQKEFVR